MWDAVQCPENVCTRDIWTTDTVIGPSWAKATDTWRTQVFLAFANDGSGYYFEYGPGSAQVSPELAYRAAIAFSNPGFISNNKEYSGNFYVDQNGIYSYTAPASGGLDSSPWDPSKIPDGTTYVGSYHTHGDFLRASDENFSSQGCNGGFSCDIGLALSPANDGKPMVLGTPLGRVEVFYPGQYERFPNGCVLSGSRVMLQGADYVGLCH